MAIRTFPPVSSATREGLLAVGGDLEIPSLIMAYSQGIFPWPIPPQIPLAWFSPDPRGILAFENLHVNRDLKKKLAKTPLCLKFNGDFARVIQECALSPHRFDANGSPSSTWITPEMEKAYTDLFEYGHAFCIEALTENGQLAAGLYGVCFGHYVACESMFYHVSGASKIIVLRLMEYLHSQGIQWVDIQMVTPTTELMGGHYVSRTEFIKELNLAKQKPKILWPKEIISGREYPSQS